MSNIEENIRESQDDIFRELSTYEREDMLERFGFVMNRKGGEAEWLDAHSVSAETKKAVSEGMAYAIGETYRVMGLKGFKN